MQAVILCGGEGTRLRPLTANTPKPLIKILGEPAIKRILKQLCAAGFERATLCTFYMADKLEAELGPVCEGVELNYCREEYPLGTAGCVRMAHHGEDALILSGDGVTGFDYRQIIDFHYKNSADITIVAREVEDPREYGLMSVSGEIVTGFLEKPGYDKCLTNLANTGCYVISHKILGRIPRGQKLDFAGDIFPEAMKEGRKICAFIDRTYWYDIGDIPSLLKCQRDMLGRAQKQFMVMEGARAPECTLNLSVLEPGSGLGKGSRAVSSLICEGAQIAAHADLSEAVIGRGCTVGEGLIMSKNSVLGDGCVLGKNVTIAQGVRVAPGTRLLDNAVVRTDVTSAILEEFGFSDDGTALGISDAHSAMKFGTAVGQVIGESAIVMCGESEEFAEAVSLGLRAAGADVYDLTGGSLGEGLFAARNLGCGYFVYMGSEGPRLLPSSEEELPRVVERKIIQSFNRFEIKPCRSGRAINASVESEKYISALKGIIPEKCGIKPVLKTDSPREAEIFLKVVPDGEGETVTFTVSSDRRTVFASTEEAVLPYEKLLILCSKACGERGEKVVLSERAPLLCDRMADVSRRPGPDEPVSTFARDPLWLAAELMRYLSDTGKSIELAASELPEIIYTRRLIETPEGLPKLLGDGFENSVAGEDLTLENQGAKAFIRPLKTGRAVQVYIESVSTEAASELTDDITRRLHLK